MNFNKKITNQIISILMLVIYLFGSLSIFSFHNHNDHDSVICKSIDSNYFNNTNYPNESHIISLKESCSICDHFSNITTEILEIKIKSFLEIYTLKEVQVLAYIYLIDLVNTLNKSPPLL